jgi:hypothetical protein
MGFRQVAALLYESAVLLNENFFAEAAQTGGRSGKNLRGEIQQIFQLRPIEAGAGVLFSTGCDVLMPGNVADGKSQANVVAQLGQGEVLGWLEGVPLEAFQLDAHRIVIAIVAASVRRFPCMPSPVMAADKLPKCPIAADKKVR